MEGHVAAARRRALERLGPGGQFDAVAGEKGRHAEERSGSSLAIEAMAERHLGGIAGAGEDELAAMTGGGAFHCAQAYHRAASKQDARSPLIAASFIDPQAEPCLSALPPPPALLRRSEEHTSELQSQLRISYA